MRKAPAFKAVLFDLDGTLADTAADLAAALNQQRLVRGLEPLPLERLRPVVSHGARGMLRVGFQLTPKHADYAAMRDEFLERYVTGLCVHTRLFDGMHAVLEHLEDRAIIWGIVTNKLQRYTEPPISALQLHNRAGCVISGDTAARAKPHPDPLLLAARRIGTAPPECLYVGDDERDVQAAHAAQMPSAVALWGYLGDGNPPDKWGSRWMLKHPEDLLALL
jgi:phosphoglycolate phosphatase